MNDSNYWFRRLPTLEQKKYLDKCDKFVKYARDLFFELYGFDILTNKDKETLDHRMILIVYIKSIIKVEKPLLTEAINNRHIRYLHKRYDSLKNHELSKVRKQFETTEKVILSQLQFLGFFDYFDSISYDSTIEPANIAERIVKVHGIEMAKEIAREIIRL
jgi:hypothetical protein